MPNETYFGHEAESGNVVPITRDRRNGKPDSVLLPYRCLADVEMKPIIFLDRPLFQRAAFHLLCGKKGVGKGTYLALLAAKLTRGDFGQPQNVLLISSEDSEELDIKPRVRAAGGDERRIFTIKRHVRLPEDIEAIKETALAIGDVGLVIIDPLGNHTGGKNSNDEGVVRNAIAPLNDLADELECPLIGVRHLGKDTERGSLTSVLGSTAWVDVPRAVLAVVADDEDDMQFHIQVIAGNRGPKNEGRTFRMELIDIVPGGEPVTKAVEIGVSSKQVDELLGTAARSSKSKQARQLILDILADVGQMESDQLDAQIARETGLSARTIQNQRMDLKNEGLLRAIPKKDEHGKVLAWFVARTNATGAQL